MVGGEYFLCIPCHELLLSWSIYYHINRVLLSHNYWRFPFQVSKFCWYSYYTNKLQAFLEMYAICFSHYIFQIFILDKEWVPAVTAGWPCARVLVSTAITVRLVDGEYLWNYYKWAKGLALTFINFSWTEASQYQNKNMITLTLTYYEILIF